MTHALVVLVLLALAGCQAGGAPLQPPVVEEPATALKAPVEPPAEERLDVLRVLPSPGLRAATEAAVARWRRAACLDIEIVTAPAEGAVVVFESETTPFMHPMPCDDDPGAMCERRVLGLERGGTITVDRLAADPEWLDVAAGIITHELGHSLGAGHPEDIANDEIMRNGANPLATRIGEASLTAVCSVRECGCFVPEVAR